jgi:hypothetical protein
MINILRFNDNSMNSFSDSEYISNVIKGLARPLIELNQRKNENDRNGIEEHDSIKIEDDSINMMNDSIKIEEHDLEDNPFFYDDLQNEEPSSSSSDSTITLNYVDIAVKEVERYRLLDMVFPSHENKITESALYFLGKLAINNCISLKKETLLSLSKYPNAYSVRKIALNLLVVLFPDKDTLDFLMRIIRIDTYRIKLLVIEILEETLSLKNSFLKTFLKEINFYISLDFYDLILRNKIQNIQMFLEDKDLSESEYNSKLLESYSKNYDKDFYYKKTMAPNNWDLNLNTNVKIRLINFIELQKEYLAKTNCIKIRLKNNKNSINTQGPSKKKQNLNSESSPVKPETREIIIVNSKEEESKIEDKNDLNPISKSLEEANIKEMLMEDQITEELLISHKKTKIEPTSPFIETRSGQNQFKCTKNDREGRGADSKERVGHSKLRVDHGDSKGRDHIDKEGRDYDIKQRIDHDNKLREHIDKPGDFYNREERGHLNSNNKVSGDHKQSEGGYHSKVGGHYNQPSINNQPSIKNQPLINNQPPIHFNQPFSSHAQPPITKPDFFSQKPSSSKLNFSDVPNKKKIIEGLLLEMKNIIERRLEKSKINERFLLKRGEYKNVMNLPNQEPTPINNPLMIPQENGILERLLMEDEDFKEDKTLEKLLNDDWNSEPGPMKAPEPQMPIFSRSYPAIDIDSFLDGKFDNHDTQISNKQNQSNKQSDIHSYNSLKLSLFNLRLKIGWKIKIKKAKSLPMINLYSLSSSYGSSGNSSYGSGGGKHLLNNPSLNNTPLHSTLNTSTLNNPSLNHSSSSPKRKRGRKPKSDSFLKSHFYDSHRLTKAQRIYQETIRDSSIKPLDSLILKHRDSKFFSWVPKTFQEIEEMVLEEIGYSSISKELERSLVFILTYSPFNTRNYLIGKKMFDTFEEIRYSYTPIPSEITEMSPPLREACLDFLSSLLLDPSFTSFIKPVNTDLHQTYVDIVRFPMCLEIIQKKMNVYRSLESFFGDLRQILKNCCYFNQNISEICNNARRLLRFVNDFNRKIQNLKIMFKSNEILINLIKRIGDIRYCTEIFYKLENERYKTFNELYFDLNKVVGNRELEEIKGQVYCWFNLLEGKSICFGV